MGEAKMGVLEEFMGSVPGREVGAAYRGLCSRRYTGGRDGRYYSAARLVRALYKTRFLRNEPTEKMRM